MLLQLWDTVVGLCSLLRRQRSCEQKLAARSYHSLFSLRTELFNNTVNNSYTVNVWVWGGFLILLSLNQHSS